MNDYSKKRIGVYFDDETIRLCDAGIALTNTKNRSEFLKDAVEFYTTVLMKNHTAEVLTPALESVIRSSIQITEDRISRNVFKQAVSTAKLLIEKFLFYARRMIPNYVLNLIVEDQVLYSNSRYSKKSTIKLVGEHQIQEMVEQKVNDCFDKMHITQTTLK